MKIMWKNDAFLMRGSGAMGDDVNIYIEYILFTAFYV